MGLKPIHNTVNDLEDVPGFSLRIGFNVSPDGITIYWVCGSIEHFWGLWWR